MAATANVTIRLSPETKRRLEALAKNQRRTVTATIETLVDRAYGDPDDFYLKMAAYQSFVAAIASLQTLHQTLPEENFRRMYQEIRGISASLHGVPPRTPPNIAAADRAHPMIDAILRASQFLDD